MNVHASHFRPPVAVRTRSGGFTLIELLVSAGITVLLATVMVTVITNVGEFWSRASGRLSVEATVRQVLDLLALDLSSALLRDDGKVWFAAEIVSDPPGERAGGVWLRFATSARGSNSGLDTLSAPIAVSYRIVRQPESPLNPWPSYSLRRGEVRPGPEAGLPELVQSRNPLQRGASLASAVTVAGDVIDFRVRCYVRDRTQADGLRLIFPVAGAKPLRATDEAGRLEARASGDDGTLFPHVVDIMLRILTEEGARLLASFEKNRPGAARTGNTTRDAQTWRQIALANSQVFTRRVVVHAQAP